MKIWNWGDTQRRAADDRRRWEDRPAIREVQIHGDRHEAETAAGALRYDLRCSVRVHERTIKAGGANINVFVVIAREKE